MSIHTRADWGAVPATRHWPLSPKLVEGIAVHWDGDPVPHDVLAGKPAEVAAFLRGVQHFHMHGNGWSDIAYNSAVDGAGGRWQLRGYDRRCGANGNDALNQRYLAVVCLLGTGQHPTPAMLEALREEIAAMRRVWPGAKQLVGHGDIRPGGTQCPGPDLERLVHAGALEHLSPAPPAGRPTPARRYFVTHVLYARRGTPDAAAAAWFVDAVGRDDVALVVTAAAARAARESGATVLAVGGPAAADLHGLAGVVPVVGEHATDTGRLLASLRL